MLEDALGYTPTGPSTIELLKAAYAEIERLKALLADEPKQLEARDLVAAAILEGWTEGGSAWGDSRYHQDCAYRAADAVIKLLDNGAEQDLEYKLQQIVSHATGGVTDGTDMSVDEIAVLITKHRNVAYMCGKTHVIKEIAEYIESDSKRPHILNYSNYLANLAKHIRNWPI